MEIGIAILVIISLLFIIGSGSIIMSLVSEKDDSLVYQQTKTIKQKPMQYVTHLIQKEDDLLELAEGLLDE
jgi:uncharacterized membrane protein